MEFWRTKHGAQEKEMKTSHDFCLHETSVPSISSLVSHHHRFVHLLLSLPDDSVVDVISNSNEVMVSWVEKKRKEDVSLMFIFLTGWMSM